MSRSYLLIFILALGAALGGCTLTPKYERPAAPVSNSWEPGSTNSSLLSTNTAADIDWRDFFDDPQLQHLIGLALTNNRDLRVASLRVEQARAQYRIQRAELYPSVQGDATMTRQKYSGAAGGINGGATLTTYTLDVGAAYEVDLFGRVRSLKKEALERYFATDEARKSAQIALISQVASEYLTLLRLREANALAQQTLKTVQAAYELNQRSFEAGAASELEVRTAEGQLETVRVNAANLLEQLAQSEHSLTVLVGQPLPADIPAGRPFQEQHLLTDLPVGVPSEALQRRPDILSAEHTLKAANANIGTARAAFFPRILLTGSAGTASAQLSDLFTGPASTWSFSPQITVPIFNLAGTRGELDVAKISKQIEIANYERSIQDAFREVADALSVRALVDQKLTAQTNLVAASQKRFDLTDARYHQGVDNYLAVLLAQQDLYAAQQDLLQYQAQRLLNAIALYRSLGGGWKNAPSSTR